jgi:hypothetical protein
MRNPACSAVVVAALVLGGCGDDSARPRTTTAARVASGEHVATAAEKEPLTNVVADFIYAYNAARTDDLCDLLTPGARRRLVSELRHADPTLARLSTCPKLVLAAYADPSDQPDAVEQASQFAFRRLTVDGDHATLTFPTGSAWRLQRIDGHWRIASFPFVPPSLASGSST